MVDLTELAQNIAEHLGEDWTALAPDPAESGRVLLHVDGAWLRIRFIDHRSTAGMRILGGFPGASATTATSPAAGSPRRPPGDPGPSPPPSAAACFPSTCPRGSACSGSRQGRRRRLRRAAPWPTAYSGSSPRPG
ncbi:hypothetical protein BJF79_07265 [Actinomadura sp. CNU-125]|uniref:hypothetical protein n=1 Tax=Actinomadura sp. CNU-125 TaxID=1904961 RepID=UPI0009654273|nr:hypothetical protein [Actinomadura sp. CNU-125]OLT34362.1 hypothetical protein BJF79_07265 [Actinomadura sp. CNU-125]